MNDIFHITYGASRKILEKEENTFRKLLNLIFIVARHQNFTRVQLVSTTYHALTASQCYKKPWQKLTCLKLYSLSWGSSEYPPVDFNSDVSASSVWPQTIKKF